MMPTPDREPTRRRADAPAAPDVRVHIETLVLEGFPPQEQGRIARAVEQELARLYATQETGRVIPETGVIDHVDAGSFEVAPGASPDAIGAQVARAIYRGLR
ncbi:MAG: hypothetical protein JXB35_15595 [Anaerolineae bacterium]|nr:hypothetical protein [Anaerolineae bacterium]